MAKQLRATGWSSFWTLADRPPAAVLANSSGCGIGNAARADYREVQTPPWAEDQPGGMESEGGCGKHRVGRSWGWSGYEGGAGIAAFRGLRTDLPRQDSLRLSRIVTLITIAALG